MSQISVEIRAGLTRHQANMPRGEPWASQHMDAGPCAALAALPGDGGLAPVFPYLSIQPTGDTFENLITHHLILWIAKLWERDLESFISNSRMKCTVSSRTLPPPVFSCTSQIRFAEAGSCWYCPPHTSPLIAVQCSLHISQPFPGRERCLPFQAVLILLLGLSFWSLVEAADSPRSVQDKTITGAALLGGGKEGEEWEVLQQDNAVSRIPLGQEPAIVRAYAESQRGIVRVSETFLGLSFPIWESSGSMCVPHWAGGTVLCSVHSVLRVLHLTTGVQDTAAAPEAAAARAMHDLLQVPCGAPETRISCQGHGPLRGAEVPLLTETRRQQRQDQPDDPAPSGSADTAATGSVTDPR